MKIRTMYYHGGTFKINRTRFSQTFGDICVKVASDSPLA